MNHLKLKLIIQASFQFKSNMDNEHEEIFAYARG